MIRSLGLGVPVVAQRKQIQLGTMSLWVRSLALLSGFRIQCCHVSCGAGCRRGSDLALLWLWRRPVAIALIRPLAWEPPYATGAVLKKTKDKKKEKKKLGFKKKKEFPCGSVD